MWFGSLRDMDEEKWAKIVVTCSPRCRADCERAGKVPPDAVLLDA